MAKVEIDLLDDGLDASNEAEAEMLEIVGDTTFGMAYTVVTVDRNAEDADSKGIEDPQSSATLTPNLQTVLSNPFNGQLYVIGNPGEVFGATANNKLNLPKSNSRTAAAIPKKRDDRRRATHNEVERKRRDKINNWITKLGRLVTGASTTNGIGPPADVQSKGGILAKACEYISELREVQERLTNVQRDNEHLAVELYRLSQEVDTLKKYNHSLRSQMAQHGIAPASPPTSLTSHSSPEAS